jgi:hypothetical protein
MWKALSEDEKKPYFEKQNEEKKKHEAALEEYNKSGVK